MIGDTVNAASRLQGLTRELEVPLVVASVATQVLILKVPIRLRNSPTKPEVPGSPTLASVNTMKQKAYSGMRSASPP